MLSKVKCVAFKGIDVIEVVVEVNLSKRGLPSFDIVGLPNKSVEESRHRVKSAFINSGYEFPECKITVNLAPADLHKVGSSYDLPVAAGIFCAQRGISLDNTFFFGELSLDGYVQQTRGDYLVGDYVSNKKYKLFASSLATHKLDGIFYVSTLREMFEHLSGEKLLPHFVLTGKSQEKPPNYDIQVADVVGHAMAKRALEICAAGGHNLMLQGSPGTGKSMLARSINSVLPPLETAEIAELRRIYSYVGKDLINIARPFRSPHHTISYSGMVGGGNEPAPGEITLAHRGVLFMDEFCEFSRNVLEALRQPMQDGYISLIRNNNTYEFPSEFTLIAAANPCPCGYKGHPNKACSCSEQRIAAYSRKLSGPLADRFDLFCWLYPEDSFLDKDASDKQDYTNIFRSKVVNAYGLQLDRLKNYDKKRNSLMTNGMLAKECRLSRGTKLLLDSAYKQMGFSPRAYFKTIKVARTIADLEQSTNICENHIAEALQFRQR